MSEIETYNIDSESEADDVLRQLSGKSLDEVEAFGQRHIKDEGIKKYFLDQARQIRNA